MAYDEEEKSTSGELEDTVKGIADHSRLERSDTGDQPKDNNTGVGSISFSRGSS